MRRLAKAMSAFTFGRSGSADGRDARSFAGRGASRNSNGSGASSYRHGRCGLVVLAIASFVALALAPAASAAPKGVAASFGNPPGSSASTLAGQFGANSPTGIAVNTTGAGPADPGDSYVVDSSNNRIQRFNSLGEFVQMWGKDVISPGATVNTDLGNVFESCTFAADCKGGVSGGLGGELAAPSGVAVDQQNGRVYVVERNAPTSNGARVQAFTGDGQFLWVIGRNAIKTSPAVNTDLGDVFEACTHAADCQSPTAGTKGGEFGIGGTIGASGGGNGIAVVPAGPTNAGNVLVTDRANTRVQEFTSAGAFVRAFGADVLPQASGSNVPNNEQQTVTVGASGGTFKLTFNGQTTVTLPYNAPATDPGTPGVVDSVQEALNDLTSVKPGGSVTVSGGPGDTTGTSPYKVTFGGGSLADLDVAQVTADSTSLLSGPGRTLTCTGGPTGGTGATTVSYQWLSNGAPASGTGATTATYTVDPTDAGKAVQCKVVAIHTAGSAPTGSTVVSAPTTVVTPSGALPTAPATITISGNATAGSTLTCPTTGWGGSPAFTFQWYRNGLLIAGAGLGTYEIPGSDVTTAANFQCAVTGSNANGTVTKVSANKTTPATPNPPGAPSPTAPTATATLAPLATTATTLQGASSFEICTNPAECKAGSGNGANPGQFGTNSPNRVAVDSGGNIYTVENSINFRLQKLTATGADLTPSIINPNVGAGGPALDLTGINDGMSPMDVAVGPSDHLFVTKAYTVGSGNPTALVAERRVVELDNAGAYVATHASRSGLPGAVYLALNTDSEEIYITTTGSSPVGGGSGVYILGASSIPAVSMGISLLGTHSAQLNGLVNPGGPGTPIGVRTKYHFEYRKVGASAWTVFAPDKDIGNGFTTVVVTANLVALEANTAYEAKLVASKPYSGVAGIETAPEVFLTPASQPDVESAYATERAATTAKLNARINPNGSATTYYFEYGTTAAYGTKVPLVPAAAGSGNASLIVSEALGGLAPETTYHFRVLATNANGTAKSADRSFTTSAVVQPPEGDRAFELVSPPDKFSGTGVGNWYSGIGAHGSAGISALEGDRYVSYSTFGSTLADGGFSYASDATLGERTPTGWVNKLAFNRRGGIGNSELAKFPAITAASDDFGLTMWEANSQMAIFEGQKEAWGNLLGAGAGSALREWGAGKWEIMAPLAPAQQIGGSSQSVFGQVIAPDGGYAIMSGGLVGVAGPTDPTADPCLMSCTRNVYIDDVTAGLSDTFPGTGVRSLVNVCTGIGSNRTTIPSVAGNGKVVAAECPPALPGRDSRPISNGGASLAANGTAPSHISDDGSRVFFMSPGHIDTPTVDAACSGTDVGTGSLETKCPPQVYVRQRNGDGSVTVRWISRSAVSGQDASLLSAAVFEGATADGDKAFFRTASPLTADDPNGGAQVPGGVTTGTASPDSVDLYMYDFPDTPGADPGDGTLTRISAGPTGAADANADPGSVSSHTSSLRALGEDGRRVYFVTAAPLTNVPAATSGTITVQGGAGTGMHLYLYDTDLPNAQRWRFITRLPSGDFGDCASTSSRRRLSSLVQGGGSQGGGVGLSNNPGTCVRVNVDASFMTFFTEARLTADDPDIVSGDLYAYDATSDELSRLSAPQGGIGGSYICVTEGSSTGKLCNGDPGLTSTYTGNRPQPSLTIDPTDRTVFFESASPLVPEDENNVYDVYQWRDGELSLISTGDPDAEPALYRGSDNTGTNVYISTRDALTWEDHDTVLDVYTAHMNGGFPEPPRPPACDIVADACQDAPSSAPAPSGASSSVLSGPGNVVERAERPKPRRCAKGKVRRGKRCVAKRKAKSNRRHANKTRRAAK